MHLRRLSILIFLTLGLGFATAGRAQSQDRLALVVGNSEYRSVAPLSNADNDAALMAEALEQTGFQVTLLLDAEQSELNRAIAAFGRSLRSGGTETTGLFYYAGHGVQSFGNNYLLPVDVELTDAADLPLVSVGAQAVLRQMASASNRTNIVILDACRNNPFEAIPDMNDNGLAEMKAPTGTFLSYSTAPGEVALDGAETNSPFTEALVDHLSDPGVPIEQMFKSVRVDVLRATNGRQVPWDTSSLTSNFSFVPQTGRTLADMSDAERWQAARDSRDPVQIVLFLRDRPGNPFEDEARALLSQVIAGAPPATESATTPAAPTPPPVQSEKEMFAAARDSGTQEDYQAYLDAYPQGVFAELAAFEISVLNAADISGETPVQSVTAPLDAPESPVTFDASLRTGGPEVIDRTFADLIAGTPLFAPFEGLPEQLWKENSCSNCHAWDRQNLCELGKSYLKQPVGEVLEIRHPYGGGFKSNLRNWAENDCR